MSERIDLDIDTSELVKDVLCEFPERCVGDGTRLCQRITTSIARAEHAYKWRKPIDEIMRQVQEDAVEVENRCELGVTIIDSRTTCGHSLGTAVAGLLFHEQPVNE